MGTYSEELEFLEQQAHNEAMLSRDSTAYMIIRDLIKLLRERENMLRDGKV